MSGASVTDAFDVIVEAVEPLGSHVRAFHLRAPDGRALPGFAAGAHIRVQVGEGGDDWRAYSLVNLAAEACAACGQAPDRYLIAVRREDAGAGGSLWMHTQVRAGQTLRIAPPVNAFALEEGNESDAADVVLIAGGIGITPIASMAAALVARGNRYALHYTGRSISQLAFVDELRALAGERLHLYGDDEASETNRFDLARLFATLLPGQPLYVCGPQGLIDAVIALAAERGWPRERIRSELFAAAPQAGDAAFEVELRQSGMTLAVTPAQTILDAMLDAGLDPLYDCKRGECGVCQVSVIEGEVDHRDYCLSEAERCSGKVMHICVSRARAARLVIDA